ncbi:CP2R1 hydroxylase, partial [Polypterus senegalus]
MKIQATPKVTAWPPVSAWHTNTAVGALLLAVVTLLLIRQLLKQRRPRGFPPGPSRLPLIGNVLSLASEPHVFMRKQSERHGQVGDDEVAAGAGGENPLKTLSVPLAHPLYWHPSRNENMEMDKEGQNGKGDNRRYNKSGRETSKKVQESGLKWCGQVMRGHHEDVGKRVMGMEEKAMEATAEVDG